MVSHTLQVPAVRELDHVDLIILVHGELPRLLCRSCETLSAAMGPEWRGTAILVENAAAPRTSAAARARVREHFPAATRLLISSSRNLGFGSAINVAMAQSRNRYVGVFNPDGVIGPGGVAALAGALDAEPGAFMAAAAVVPFSSSPEPRGPEISLDWLPGGATLYRRESFLEIGGYDPMYFLYAEDVEISRRARRSGWLLLRVPEATFHHEHEWDAWERFRRLRRWTASATTLSYQLAPSRRKVAGQLAIKRAKWFATMARERRLGQLAGAMLGTAWWLTRVPRIESRRRHPWNGDALEAWLERALPRLELSPLE